MKGSGVLAASIIAMVMAGCGGGGGNSSASNTAPEKEAVTNNFAVTAKVDGTAVPNLSISSGSSGAIAIASSQQLELDSTAGVSWTASLGTTKEISPSSASGVYTAVLFNAVDSTVTYTATSLNDSSKKATITVNVTGQRFAPAVVKVGDYDTYESKTITVDGGKYESIYTNKVTSIYQDGSYMVDQFNASDVKTYTMIFLGNGTRTSFTTPTSGGDSCVYTPSQGLLVYPLYVGQTFSTSNAYQCGTGPGAYQEKQTIAGTVVSYEPITVAAGTFNTLKIQRTTKISDSTDAILGTFPNKGYTLKETVWVDTVSMRNVKSSLDWVYPATAPGNFNFSRTIELTAHLKQ